MNAPVMPLAPGFHENVPANVYHADPCERPSLSSSLAKIIVDQTPRKAWLAHPRLNPDFAEESDDKFNLGTSVHDFLASGGARVRVIPNFKDYRKDAAQAERDKLKAAGLVPLLEHQADAVNEIVRNVMNTLFKRGIDLGAQEAVFVAEDRGVLLRAMMDSFNPPWINDFKVTKINLASDFVVAKHIVEFGYDLSAAFYLRVAGLVFPQHAGRLRFRWIFVEEDEPFGIRIVEADNTCLEMGRRKADHAKGVWQQCLESNRWPHLEHLPPTVPYPAFKETAWLEREQSEGFIQGPMAALKDMRDRGEF